MTLFGDKQISLTKRGEMWYNFDGEWRTVPVGSPEESLLQGLRRNRNSPEIRQLYKSVESTFIEKGYIKVVSDPRKVLIEGIGELIDFFAEFQFTPNFRFINTLCRHLDQGGNASANEFVCNYFKLFDSPSAPSIADKLKSAEVQEIYKHLSVTSPEVQVNTRFKIYYGPQGTGKTTQAMSEASECIVCHSAMLPSDLMEDFKFIDGKATFDPSPLWHAMENGTSIVLDEINLLPFESLRFLQSILDGKAEFIYKGKHIEIKEGFKVIGTMNLYVNQIPYPLPEPLVDRCEDIVEASLDAQTLVGAVLAS